MKKVRIVFAAALFLVANMAIAQFSVGIKTGVNFNNIAETEALDALTPEFQQLIGFNIGAIAELDVNEHFSIQPELTYTQKGFKLDEGTNVDLFNIPLPVGVVARSKFSYIEMPLLFKGKVGDEKVKGFLLAGPSIGYAVDGQLTTTARALFEFQVLDQDLNLNSIGYERFEATGIVGGGAEFAVPSGKVFVDARYQFGFTQLYDIPVFNEKIKNRGVSLNVGYAMAF